MTEKETGRRLKKRQLKKNQKKFTVLFGKYVDVIFKTMVKGKFFNKPLPEI